ncbi:MAG: Uncharacterised protein [Synechococcus sp. CC9902]|nr:MAG: Uncharacterised protein [Synechococcus sp. CC9902]
MTVIHFAKLSHWPMNSIQAGFEQQPQSAGAAALLQGVPSAFQSGNLPLQPGLLLFQSCSCALLHRQGVRGLLDRLFPVGNGMQQVLPVLFQLLHPSLHTLFVFAVLALLLLQFHQPLRFLTQPLLKLLLFLLERAETGQKSLATAAAAFLLLQPGSGAPCHVRKSAA